MSTSRLRMLQDWQNVDRSLNQIALPFEHTTFAASPSSDTSIYVRHYNDSLLVRGSTIDRIAKKSITLGSDQVPGLRDHLRFAPGMAVGLTDILYFFFSGIELAQELDPYPTNERRVVVALRTFLRGPPSAKTQSQMVSMQEGVLDFLSYARLWVESSKNEDKESVLETIRMRAQEQEEQMAGLINGPVEAANQRCFCTTEKGFFGLVPGKAEIGDEVAILNGGNVPFILRPFETGNEQELVYRLVGDGYFHGLMHGEASSLDTYDERDLVIV